MRRHELAACLGTEKLARIEIVHRTFARDERGQRQGFELRLWTALVPKRVALGDLGEERDFLHAAVAIRAHDQDRSFEPARRREPQDDVVMKLPLFPMREELVAAVCAA